MRLVSVSEAGSYGIELLYGVPVSSCLRLIRDSSETMRALKRARGFNAPEIQSSTNTCATATVQPCAAPTRGCVTCRQCDSVFVGLYTELAHRLSKAERVVPGHLPFEI